MSIVVVEDDVVNTLGEEFCGFIVLALGSKVSSHRIEKGQQQITLNAAAPGIYFIDVEGSRNQIKWVVE